jgi:hypothetical protein
MTTALLPLLLALTAVAQRPTGSMALEPTYNVTPNPGWQPGRSVYLYIDARRNPAPGAEDVFFSQQFPGAYQRAAGQRLSVPIPNVAVGEKIIVQGYMCAEGTTDCYPSDKDNPPSCSVVVHVLGGVRPSCQPVFTWTGGSGTGGVLCSAVCI